LLLPNLIATLSLAAIAWSLQFVQLPLLRPADAPRHRRLNTRLIVLPILVEAIATLWLLFSKPSPRILAATALWIGALIATAGYTFAHSRAALHRLPRWNLARAVCWTLRSAILVSVIQ